tara:strand:+ start:513 stop:1115 length:603 start_codon:yes stop_codon:yes gene_type:complete
MLKNPTLPVSYKDGSVKYVEFEPDLPKDTDIQKYCVPVPWTMYASKKKEIEKYILYYITDVVSDRRLGIMARSQDENPTNNPNVQQYAFIYHNDGGHMGLMVNANTVWVMEFVNKRSFARYCLVPSDSMPLSERLENALSHLEEYMNDQSMANTKRQWAAYENDYAPPAYDTLQIDEQYAHFKRYWVYELKKLIKWEKEQ